MNILGTVSVFLLLALGASDAGAHSGRFHHGGVRVGVVIGVPLWAPRFDVPAYTYPAPYPYPSSYPYYYSYAPPITILSSPPTYVEMERQNAPMSPSTPNYWYYCDDPSGYYPYVKQCNHEWQMVAPSPSPPSGARR